MTPSLGQQYDIKENNNNVDSEDVSYLETIIAIKDCIYEDIQSR